MPKPIVIRGPYKRGQYVTLDGRWWKIHKVTTKDLVLRRLTATEAKRADEALAAEQAQRVAIDKAVAAKAAELGWDKPESDAS